MTVFWLSPMTTLAALLAAQTPGAPPGVGPLVIDGDAICPTAAEVSARFSSLLPPSVAGALGAEGDAGRDRARIDAVEDMVEIVLRGPDGTLIGRRRLRAQGPCDERARVAAIVLATWESDVHPAFERPVAPPLETPPQRAATDVVKPLSPVVPPARVNWDLGVGVTGSLAGGALVAGARLTGALLGRGGLGAQVAMGGEGDRSTEAGMGQAVWSRYTAGVGPAYRRSLGAWAIDADVMVVAALFRVHGEQYPVSYQGRGWDGGASAGVRLIAPGRSWRPWLSVDATRWLDARDIRENVSGQVREIPTWMAATSLGFSFFSR